MKKIAYQKITCSIQQNARKTYRCFPVFGGGQGGFQGIIILSFFDLVACVSSSSLLAHFPETRTFVAIQWHISGHSGLSQNGESGSIKAIVNARSDDHCELELGWPWRLTTGASRTSSGPELTLVLHLCKINREKSISK
jgi:hypothetical protein